MFAVCCLLFPAFIPAARFAHHRQRSFTRSLVMFRAKQRAKQDIERVEQALVTRLNQIVRHAQQLQLAGVVAFHRGLNPFSMAGVEHVHDAIPR